MPGDDNGIEERRRSQDTDAPALDTTKEAVPPPGLRISTATNDDVQAEQADVVPRLPSPYQLQHPSSPLREEHAFGGGGGHVHYGQEEEEWVGERRTSDESYDGMCSLLHLFNGWVLNIVFVVSFLCFVWMDSAPEPEPASAHVRLRARRQSRPAIRLRLHRRPRPPRPSPFDVQGAS